MGFWLFWSQYKSPKFLKAGALGIIFGLSFLNRTEGLLYLAVIPFLQAAAIYFGKCKYYGLKRYVTWSFIFIFCFTMVAVPQILRVSHKVGTFAINGRQVWLKVMKYSDGNSVTEKLFGLDYSPSQYNMEYLKLNPNALKHYGIKPNLIDYAKAVVKNIHNFYTKKLGVLIGPLGLIFFGFGILALYQRELRFETFMILSFMVFCLVAPLLDSLYLRHIVSIAPIMMLVEGIGILYISRILLEGYKSNRLRIHLLAIALLLAMVGASAYQLRMAFRPPQYIVDYSIAEQKKPLAIIKKITENELKRPPNISAQRRHISYFAGGNHYYVPFANFKKLVNYCRLNDIDFLYLKHSRVREYPFFDVFLQTVPPQEFRLLYSGVDAYGEKIELYRFLKK